MRGDILGVHRPDIASEWHPTRNVPLMATEVTVASRLKVWWLCRSCGYEWMAMIAPRTRPDAASPGCRACRKRLRLEVNSLAKQRPDLAAEWHPTKNGSLTPYDVEAGERREVWWRCVEGHEFSSRIDTRTTPTGHRLCRDCYWIRSARRLPLSESHPHIAATIHPTLNNPVPNPELISAGSGRRLWWRCSEGHEWEASVIDRIGTSGCPFCLGRRVSPATCLAATNPDAAARWHPTRNDRSPTDVTPGSDYRAWFICGSGHEYRRAVYTETRGVGCLACRLEVSPEDSLAWCHPDVASEWHPTKNDMSPEEVTKANGYRAWWRCTNGHEWQTSVSNRTVAGTGCPDCFRPVSSRQEGRVGEALKVAFCREHEDIRGPIAGVGQIGKVDFVFRDLGLVVEFDGSYWHQGREDRDIDKAYRLRELGWTVIRIRERPLPILTTHDVVSEFGEDVADVADRVRRQWEAIRGSQPLILYSDEAAAS